MRLHVKQRIFIPCGLVVFFMSSLNVLFSNEVQSKFKTWTSQAGTKIQARLINADHSEVNLKTNKGKVIRLDSTAENIYSNNEKFYFRGIREKSDIDAGIAYNLIIGTTENFKPLIGTKCTTSVRYLNDAIFGINKCKLSTKQKSILNNIN